MSRPPHRVRLAPPECNVSRAWAVDGLDPDGPVLANARRVLAVRIAEFYSYAPIVPHPELAEALHDLRISAKRLRYTLEIFRDQFGKSGERQIDRLKSLQEALGELHDHDVRLELIADELARLSVEQRHRPREAFAQTGTDEVAPIASSALPQADADPGRGLVALLGREQAARRASYVRFLDLWDRYTAEGMRSDLVSLSTKPMHSPSAGRSV